MSSIPRHNYGIDRVPMTIKNELSTEIASAILTTQADSPERLDELKEIVLKVHATLQQMSEQTRSHSCGPKLPGRTEDNTNGQF